MIKISVAQLKKLSACENGIKWFKNQPRRTLRLVIGSLLIDNRFDYAKWLLKSLLTKEQNQLWAINSAESILELFERKFPNDMRPRQAIQAAKDFLSGKNTVKAAKAADAAAYAADAAAYAVKAAYAVDAAAYAAKAADAADYAAAYAATNAADAADAATNAAAYAATNAADAKRKKQIEVCNFALRLLGEIK